MRASDPLFRLNALKIPTNRTSIALSRKTTFLGSHDLFVSRPVDRWPGDPRKLGTTPIATRPPIPDNDTLGEAGLWVPDRIESSSCPANSRE